MYGRVMISKHNKIIIELEGKMKQLIAFVMTLLMATTLISVSAETYPMDTKGLQEWDVQENEG